MLIRLCHTYNPAWAYMAKALLGAHGVEVSVVHEQAMHLYAPGSTMPGTLLVEEKDWEDAVEILQAEPVEVDSAPVPPPLPGADMNAEGESKSGPRQTAPLASSVECEVEHREHYFPDSMAYLMARVMGGGALAIAALVFGWLRRDEDLRWLKSMGSDLAAQDLGYAVNLLLGHVITTPFIMAMVPVWVWFRQQHAAVYRLDELRREAADLEEELQALQGEGIGGDR